MLTERSEQNLINLLLNKYYFIIIIIIIVFSFYDQTRQRYCS